MSNRPYKPHGIPALLPYLTVRNVEKTIAFYKEAFGFELLSEPVKDDQGYIQHAEMKFGEDVVIMFAPEGAYGSLRTAPITQGTTPSVVLYVYCQDVDALYNKAIAAGATSTIEPNDSFWGDRFCSVIDPDGHEWSFATNFADYQK
jgi:uncharacterized glyoxalase superfamily protein PhnB